MAVVVVVGRNTKESFSTAQHLVINDGVVLGESRRGTAVVVDLHGVHSVIGHVIAVIL